MVQASSARSPLPFDLPAQKSIAALNLQYIDDWYKRKRIDIPDEDPQRKKEREVREKKENYEDAFRAEDPESLTNPGANIPSAIQGVLSGFVTDEARENPTSFLLRNLTAIGAFAMLPGRYARECGQVSDAIDPGKELSLQKAVEAVAGTMVEAEGAVDGCPLRATHAMFVDGVVARTGACAGARLGELAGEDAVAVANFYSAVEARYPGGVISRAPEGSMRPTEILLTLALCIAEQDPTFWQKTRDVVNRISQ